MMTLTTDAQSKEVFKKVQDKNAFFYERTFGKRSNHHNPSLASLRLEPDPENQASG